MNPPVPGVEASRKVSGETTWALPADSTTWLRVSPWLRNRSGSTSTWSCWSRIPQTDTLATPGTPSSCGRITQWAMTDCSMLDSSSDDMPIMSTRLEEDSGWSIVGGFDTCGSAWAWASRSSMSCRSR